MGLALFVAIEALAVLIGLLAARGLTRLLLRRS